LNSQDFCPGSKEKSADRALRPPVFVLLSCDARATKHEPVSGTVGDCWWTIVRGGALSAQCRVGAGVVVMRGV